MQNYFITATDTDAGKTFVACAIAQALINQGKKVAVYKPVAAGCQFINNELVNEDAQLLHEFANARQKINEVNPITLEQAIAPHIAAENTNREITLDEINDGYNAMLSLEADFNLTEGAGGWRLPINTHSTPPIYLSDFAIKTKQDVILIVNMKLGCLNHALLTYQAIIADGLNCVAWIANNASEDVMSNLVKNIESLEQLLPIPKIAQLPFFSDTNMSVQSKIQTAANQIDCRTL